MKGTWTGSYRYNSTQHHNIDQLEVDFTIEITTFDGIHFSGTIKDDLETSGTPGIGTINGTIKNGRIEFTKQMPVLTLMTNQGRKEYPTKHIPLLYEGEFSEAGNLSGKWRFKRRFIFSRHVIALGIGGTGTWQMTKQE